MNPGTTPQAITSVTSGQSPDFQCVVSADLVRRALMVASGDVTRFYLRGVHVSPHPKSGAYIVGTDGVILACFHDPKAIITGQMILFPDERLRDALVAERGDSVPRLLLARKDRLLVAAVQHDKAEALLEGLGRDVLAAQFREATIDGAYPDWRKTMLPIDPAGRVPALDARKLHRLGKALSGDGSSRALNLKPTGSADFEPVWAFGSLPNSVGIIAGLRPSPSVRSDPPAWLPEEIPALSAKAVQP